MKNELVKHNHNFPSLFNNENVGKFGFRKNGRGSHGNDRLK